MYRPSADPVVQERWLRVRNQIDLRPCDGCHQCRIRCASGVQLTRHEYDGVRELERGLDPDRLRTVLGQDKSVDLGDGVEVRMCRYLDMDGGGCVVYDARPLVCRLLGHVEWMPCPVGKIERPADTQDALSLVRAYAGQERLTFEQWDERVGTESA